MSELINISVSQLFSSDEEVFNNYYNLLKHLSPKIPKTKITSLQDLSFGEVAEIKRKIQNPKIENIISIFKTAFDYEEKEFLLSDTITFFHSFVWLKKELELIANIEKNLNSDDVDFNLKQAGIERLSIFGEMNTLIAIGEKFRVAPQEVENWNYKIVYALSLHNKISNEIQKKYNELMIKK